MGKHSGYSSDVSGMYDQSRNNEIASHLEAYIDAVQKLFILEGRKEEDVKADIKKVRKACKHLRNGHPEKVFDPDRYEEYMNGEVID